MTTKRHSFLSPSGKTIEVTDDGVGLAGLPTTNALYYDIPEAHAAEQMLVVFAPGVPGTEDDDLCDAQIGILLVKKR